MIKKKDYLLIAVVILVALVVLVITRMTAGSGTKVVISQNGEVYGTYDLNEDQVIVIDTSAGINKVQIENRIVCMIEADCPDQICVNTHPLSVKEPGIIVCLPHKLTVEIKE
ncbi:MAG: NusG domain II-containing protein [Lachnospiraceae bacterium]|nr:NusG domain II-containing protein [Lachnospiraceae bacterium]